MARTPLHIDADLHYIRKQLRDMWNTHKDLHRACFVEKTMSGSDFLKLSTENRELVKNAQQREETLVQELEALA